LNSSLIQAFFGAETEVTWNLFFVRK